MAKYVSPVSGPKMIWIVRILGIVLLLIAVIMFLDFSTRGNIPAGFIWAIISIGAFIGLVKFWNG